MLSLEVMGLFALAIFWVSVLLIGADIGVEVRDLFALGKVARASRRAKVVRGDADGTLASFGGIQAGHALDGKPAIELSHALLSATVHGGAVRAGDQEIEIAPNAPLRVWVSERALLAAGDERPEDLTNAFEKAVSPRGFERELRLPVREGDEVFYAPGQILATLDPRAVVRRHVALLSGFGVVHLTIAGVVTAIALSAPMETWTAKMGAAGCVAWFLLSPAILRSVRAATRTPDQARNFWRWNLA